MRPLLLLASVALLTTSHAHLTAQASDSVVISQVYGGGGNSGATLRQDFIELFNRGATPADVTGWSVQYAASTGTTWQRTDLAGVIPPGGYLLVQQATGTGGTTDVPGPDIVGTVPMSASAGKVALVSTAATLSGSCPTEAILDFVGYGPATNCAETQPTSPNLGSTTAAFRKLAGCQDSNNNLEDFANAQPAPRSSASPLAPCASGPALIAEAGVSPASVQAGDPIVITATVIPASDPPSSGISAEADLASIGANAATPLTDDGVNGDALAGDGVFSGLAVVLPGTTPGRKTLTVTARDLEGRIATDAVTLQVTAPVPVLLPHEVQGTAQRSRYTSQLVAVEGVVTARKFNGFFLQTRDGERDADPLTSEGLFVFTGGAPPAAAVIGHRARVTGRVAEFVPATSPYSLPLTEIEAGATVINLGEDVLPQPVVLSAADLNPDTPVDGLERLEGMRIAVASLTVVAPTAGSVDENDAFGTNNGLLYAVVSGMRRPFREAGIPILQPLPPCAGCSPPRFDENPERLRVDSDALLGTAPLAVATGAVLGNVTGVLDYGGRAYTLLPEPGYAVSAGVTATPVRVAAPGELTVASFNLQRFFDSTNDPAIGEPVLTPAAYAYRLAKLSRVVREYLQLPDVIGVQEAENLQTLQAVAARVNADAGLGDDYAAYLVEGNDVGGIDVGLLVRTSRVEVASVEQVGIDASYIDPGSGNSLLLNDRPPLVLRATARARSGSADWPFIVVVNHLRSLNGVDQDPGDGPRVREKRRTQAEFLAALLDRLQDDAPVISVGDYNAFEVNDGLVDVLGTVSGRPTPPEQVVFASPDLVDPDYVNAALGTYSYVFEGNAQSLDHVLLSQGAATHFVELQHARVNADFPEVLRGALDSTGAPRPERLSDHDPAVAYFRLPADTTPPRIASVTPSQYLLWPADGSLVPITLAVEAQDTGGTPVCGVSGVFSSEPVSGGNDTTKPDWIVDGPLSLRLRAERRGLGLGRLYLVVVDCTDGAGNRTEGGTGILVPRFWW